MQTVTQVRGSGISRWILVAATIALSSFFMWRFFVSGFAYDAASGLGFLLITPQLWTSPFNLFAKLNQEFQRTLTQAPPHIFVTLANGLGLVMIIAGSVLRWFTL